MGGTWEGQVVIRSLGHDCADGGNNWGTKKQKKKKNQGEEVSVSLRAAEGKGRTMLAKLPGVGKLGEVWV